MKQPQNKLRRTTRVKKITDPRKRQQLAEWVEAEGAEAAAQRVFSEWGLGTRGKAVSKNTIWRALAYWRLEARLSAAFAESDALQELMRKFRPEDPQLARQFGEFVLLAKANRNEDAGLFTAAARALDSRRNLELKEQQLALSERRLKLLEKRERQARKDTENTPLTPEEKERRIKAVFGITS